jgi:hypothetical protein
MIIANQTSGPLARSLWGQSTLTLDGTAVIGTINIIDGVQSFGNTKVLALQSVLPSVPTPGTGALTLTAVAASSGGVAVYTGTITGGAANALVGVYFTVAGFTLPSDNGFFVATASTATTLTLANPSAVAQTHAGTATSGYAAYQSTGADSSIKVGDSVTIAGFSNSANNGTFTVEFVNSTQVLVNNGAAVAETNPAATLVDTQNAIPLAIYATTQAGTDTAYIAIEPNVVTGTTWTFVLSGAGTASETVLVNFVLIMPGI